MLVEVVCSCSISHTLLRYFECIAGSDGSSCWKMERKESRSRAQAVPDNGRFVRSRLGVGWVRKQSRGNVKVLAGIAIGE